jgi:hypothetical protein
MDTSLKIEYFYLVAHIVAYAICCKNTYRWKCIYMPNIIFCIKLQVDYNLSYANVPNVVACGMCN